MKLPSLTSVTTKQLVITGFAIGYVLMAVMIKTSVPSSARDITTPQNGTLVSDMGPCKVYRIDDKNYIIYNTICEEGYQSSITVEEVYRGGPRKP